MQIQTSQALEQTSLEINSYAIPSSTPDFNELENRRILQICSALLEYPDFFTDLDSPCCHLDSPRFHPNSPCFRKVNTSYLLLSQEITELKNPHVRESLLRFWKHLQKQDPIARAEHYVSVFDFNPSTSLYLTSSLSVENKNEIQNGIQRGIQNRNEAENKKKFAFETKNQNTKEKSQNQGMALVHLKELYKEAGFILESNQLPDYLPLFLEFLSVASIPTIRCALKMLHPAIKQLVTELRRVKSPYALILDVCLIEFSILLTKEDSV